MSGEEDISRFKLSVAMAIIRNKPDGMTGREYAQQLSDQIKTREFQWKQRYHGAESEILHLKQQLALKSIGINSCSQPDLPSTQKSEDLLPADSQPLFPTPPASGSNKSSQVPGHNTSSSSMDPTTLTRHTHFLQQIINIENSCQFTQVGNKVDQSSVLSVIYRSLLDSLVILQNYLGKEIYSWTLQKSCINTIVSYLNKMSDPRRAEIVEKIKDLCTNIISSIETADEHNISQSELHLHLSVLQEFASSAPILPHILVTLCQTVYNYSALLRHKDRQELHNRPLKFSSMFYIFKACEKCLLLKNCKALDVTIRASLRNTLEDSLLHLTNLYPLYAHVVWKLCGYLLP